MKSIIVAITGLLVFVLAAGTVSAQFVETFSVPASAGTWVKMQDTAQTVQWSTLHPDATRLTRIDLVSATEGEDHMVYYLVRRACSRGGVELQVVYPGNILGVRMGCNGELLTSFNLYLLMSQVDELPAEAQALLP